jgi:alcohol dehydrogenase
MFSFHMDTRIEFGVGKVEKLPEFLRQLDIGTRLFVVTDPGILRAGIVDPIVDALTAAGFPCTLFSEVKPNPRDTDCLNGVEQFIEAQADCVLAIGGGSAMDTAKTIALLGKTGGMPSEYADGLLPYTDVYPVVCVPTTAGTGSEVTRSAVITESTTHRKVTLKHALLRPRLAVLDPQLTTTVPKSVTAATGVDALVHAIEGTTCTLSSPVTRAFGYAAMPLIVKALPRAVANGEDMEARTDMLLGSLLAGLCFGNADVAAVHCLAEALGGLYDTPHGVANAVFLPHVLRFNAEGAPEVHAELSRLMGFAAADDPVPSAVEKLLDGIRRWTAELGIPALRDLPGVTPSDFPRLAELAYANGSTPSNIRPIDMADYLTLLEQAWNDPGVLTSGGKLGGQVSG